tara:strand:- start:53 stop:7531 length:7479 start_codon:yes stop_codon:yes gene_type:complete
VAFEPPKIRPAPPILSRADLIGKLPAPKKLGAGVPPPMPLTAFNLPSQRKKSVTISSDLIPAFKPPEPEKSGWGLAMGALSLLDWGRAAVNSTIKEGIDVLQGEGFNFGDWRKQTNNRYGFGELIHDERQAMGLGLMLLSPFTMGVSGAMGAAVMMDNIWADRVVGTIGDFATDPMMWMGGLPGFLARGVGTAPKLIAQMAKMATTTSDFTAAGNRAYASMAKSLKPFAEKQGVKSFTRNDVRTALEQGIVGSKGRRTLTGVGSALGKQDAMGVALREFLGAKPGLVARMPMTGAAGRLMRGDKWIERAGQMVGKSDDWFARQQLKNIPDGWKYEWADDDLVKIIQAGREGRRASGAMRRQPKLEETFMKGLPNIKDATSVALAAARTPLEIALPSWSRKVGLGGAVLNRVMDLPVRGAMAVTPKAAQDRLRLMFLADPVYETVDPATKKVVKRNLLTDMLDSDDPYEVALAYNFRTDMRWARGKEDFFNKAFDDATRAVEKRGGTLRLSDEDITDLLDTALDMQTEGLKQLAVRSGPFYDNLPDRVKALNPESFQQMVNDLDSWVKVIDEHTLSAYAGANGRWRMADDVVEMERMAYRSPRRMLSNAQKRLLEPKFHNIVNEGNIDNYGFKIGGVKQDTLPFDASGRLTPASLKARNRKVNDFVQIYDDASEATEGTLGSHLPKGATEEINVLLNADGSIFRLQDPNDVGLSFRRQIDDAYERAFNEKAFEGKFSILTDSYKRGMGRDMRVEHFLKRAQQYYPMVKLDDLLDDIEGTVAAWDEAERGLAGVKRKIETIVKGKKNVRSGETIPAAKFTEDFNRKQADRIAEEITGLQADTAAKLSEVRDLNSRIIHAESQIENISDTLSAKGVDLEELFKNAQAKPVRTWRKQAPDIVAEVLHASQHVDELAKMHDLITELQDDLFRLIKRDLGREMPLSRASLEAERSRLVALEQEFRAVQQARVDAADRIKVIEQELPADSKNFERLTRQLVQKEETLPVLEKQAEVLKPLDRDISTDPAIQELTEIIDAAAIRYTNLIDELDTVMDRITYFTRRKKFADENWVKVQKSLKTGRSAAQFLQQLNKSKTLRLKQLKDAREKLEVLVKQKNVADKQLREKSPAYGRKMELWEKQGQKPSDSKTVPDALKGTSDESEWVRLQNLKARLNARVKESEITFLNAMDASVLNTRGYEMKLKNKRILQRQLDAERSRGPFKKGGAAEKRRLERIAGMELRWQRNNYDEVVDVNIAGREVDRSKESLSVVQKDINELRTKAQDYTLANRGPRPEAPALTGRETQRINTARKKVRRLQQYEKGYGDLASAEDVAAAEKVTRLTDELIALQNDIIDDPSMLVTKGPRQGQWARGYMEQAPLGARVEAQRRRIKLLEEALEIKTKEARLQGPLIEIGKTGPAPVPSSSRLAGVSPDNTKGIIKIKRTKEVVDYTQITNPTVLDEMQEADKLRRLRTGESFESVQRDINLEGLPSRTPEEFIDVRVQKVGGRWEYQNLEEDLGGYLTNNPQWRDKARSQGWRLFDEGVDPTTGRPDINLKEVTAMEQELSEMTRLRDVAQREAQITKQSVDAIEDQIILATDEGQTDLLVTLNKEFNDARIANANAKNRLRGYNDEIVKLETEAEDFALTRVGELTGTPYESTAPARLKAEQEDIALLKQTRNKKIAEGFAKKDERDELLDFLEQDLPPANVAEKIEEVQATFKLNLDTLNTSIKNVRDQIAIVNQSAKKVALSDETVQGLRELSTFLSNLKRGVAGTEGLTSVSRLGKWADQIEEVYRLEDIFAHEKFSAASRNADSNLSSRQVLAEVQEKAAAFQNKTDDLVEKYGLGVSSPFEDVQITLQQADELQVLKNLRNELSDKQQRLLESADRNNSKIEAKKVQGEDYSIRQNDALQKIHNLEQQVLRMEQEDLVQATAEWEASIGANLGLRQRVSDVIKETEGAARMRGGTSVGATMGRTGAEFADTLKNTVKGLHGIDLGQKAGKASAKMRKDSMAMLRDAVSSSEWGPWSLMNSKEAMNQDVAAVINAFAKINDPVESAWMWKKWDGLQSWLKAGMIATPGFVERNIFGAFFNAWLDGVNLREITNARKLVNKASIKAVREQTDFLTAARSLAQSKDKDAVLYKDVVDLLEAGVRGGGQAVSSVDLQYGLRNARSLELILGGKIRTGGKQVSVVLNPLNPRFAPFNAVRSVNSWAEDIIRIGVGMDTLRFGGNIDDALERIAKTQFDYDELTQWERTWARRFIPFYTWTRKNLPYQLDKFFKQPYKYNRLISLKRNLEMGTEEEGVVPDYYMEPFGLRLPFKYKGARVYTAPDFPFQDLFRYADVEDPLSGLKEIGQQIAASTSPIIKTPLEVSFGKNIFTGVAFTGRYQQAPNPITKIEPLMQVLDELGMAEKNFHGDWKMRDHHIFLVNGLLPTISLIRRAWPNERKYQRNHLRNVISFLGGVNVNFNTAEVQYNWVQGKKWDELSRRQDMQDLLRRVK